MAINRTTAKIKISALLISDLDANEISRSVVGEGVVGETEVDDEEAVVLEGLEVVEEGDAVVGFAVIATPFSLVRTGDVVEADDGVVAAMVVGAMVSPG